MELQEDPQLNNKRPVHHDELAQLAEIVERVLARRDFSRAATIIDENFAATFLSFPPHRSAEIFDQIVTNIDHPPPFLVTAHRIMRAAGADLDNTRALTESFDGGDPSQMFVLSLFRMADFRMHGRIAEAVEQVDSAETHLAHPSFNPQQRRGWMVHAAVQIGITMMLAGDFTRALSSFMRAQMLPAAPPFTFLEREAIVKSALIHASFGNATTADGLLKRTGRIQRTSSWVETHLDAQEEFVRTLTYSGDVEEALDRLEAISLQDIGEMWPFYIVALHRILEASGHHDELELQLEMIDTLPYARIDGEGFTGSVIPLKRAMVALRVGRGAKAVRFLERADPKLTYTKLVKAATDLYLGRTQQALDQAHELRKETRGFRLMEIRRLSIMATAQHMRSDYNACIETLRWAASLPRGLSPHETLLFNTDMQQLAAEHVETWPQPPSAKPIFLPDLPKPGRALTGREIEILELLALGHSRAEIAEQLFISVSTVKTQLQSLYRKLDVSSAADAVFEGERRGVI
jgi:DNA-binding CsgD family transcriptional regulator